MLLHSRPEDPFKVPKNFDVGRCSLLDAQHFFSHLDKRLIARVVMAIANKTSILKTIKRILQFAMVHHLANSLYEDHGD